MHVGVDSFVSTVTDPRTGHVVGPEERMAHLLEEIALADASGLHSFGIGEHHREEYYDSAPPVILAAAAARTSRIRLGSAVTVLSAADPVRVFQQFATLDLISQGRIDLVVGRGSFTEAFPLFGLDLADYDSLFAEKLDLLLKIRDSTHVTWSGSHRPPLTGQGVYPRPLQNPLPIWVGVGGTPESFARAGLLGLPLMVAIIGGEPRRFAPLVDLYRRAGAAGRPRPRGAEGRPARLRLRRREHPVRGRHDLPGLAPDVHPGLPRARLPAPTRAQFDATSGPDGAFFMGDPETSRQDPAGLRPARRGRPGLAADDQPAAGARRPAARHRAARHRGRARGSPTSESAAAASRLLRFDAPARRPAVAPRRPLRHDHLRTTASWAAYLAASTTGRAYEELAAQGGARTTPARYGRAAARTQPEAPRRGSRRAAGL